MENYKVNSNGEIFLRSYGTIFIRFSLVNLALIVFYIIAYISLVSLAKFIIFVSFCLPLQFFLVIMPFIQNQKWINHFVTNIEITSEQYIYLFTVKTSLFKARMVDLAVPYEIKKTVLKEIGEVLEVRLRDSSETFIIPINWFDSTDFTEISTALNSKAMKK